MPVTTLEKRLAARLLRNTSREMPSLRAERSNDCFVATSRLCLDMLYYSSQGIRVDLVLRSRGELTYSVNDIFITRMLDRLLPREIQIYLIRTCRGEYKYQVL